MNVAAYLRVSTQRQAEQGMGLEVQRAHIERWAEENGHTVTVWARDEGVSGSNGLDTRQGLYEALRAVQDGSAGGLVVYRLDRLARDLVLQETLLGMIWKEGGQVFSTSPGEDENLDPTKDAEDPSRRLSRQILGAVAEYERAMIRLRLRSGKLAKQVRGGYVGGAVPYGFDVVGDGRDSRLVTNETEQKALAVMREMRADGATYQAICDALTDQGYQTKRGGRWLTASVRKVLLRDAPEGV